MKWKKEISDISKLTSALYFLQQKSDVELIAAYLHDFKPPKKVEVEYYDLAKQVNSTNYSKIVEKIIDLLANVWYY